MSDEALYEIAMQEYNSSTADAALRSKAYVVAEGVESKIKLEYIKLRVAQLKRQNHQEPASGLLVWFNGINESGRFFLLLISLLLIPLFGLGLIPLFLLIYLAQQERGLAKHSTKSEVVEKPNSSSKRTA